MSIAKDQENRTPIRVRNNDYTDGDARRELESTRHVKEPHVIEPPREPEDMDSRIPVAQVGVRHSADNPLVDILPQNATDALDEATNRKHAHIDRARSGGSTIVK